MVEWSETERAEITRILAPLVLEPPATEAALAQLTSFVSAAYEAPLPDDYLAFLRIANGGDGELESGFPVVFWKAELLREVNEESQTEAYAPGMCIVGSDAGDTLFGIDLRRQAPPERYVETEDVGIGWDYIFWRGPSFLALLQELGSR